MGKRKKKKKHVPEKQVKTDAQKFFSDRRISPKIKKLFLFLPVIIILILSLIYFAPFLSGKKMIYGSDWLSGEYAKRAWSTNYLLENKELPKWLPHLFGGCPTISSFFSDHLSPNTLLYIVSGPKNVHTVRVFLFVIYTFLAGLGIYLLLKEMKLGIFPSIMGGLCYMFSGSFISTTYAGHLGRAISVSLLPLMLLFILKGVRRRKFFYFVFFAGITSLAFLAGHFQMTYYAVGFSIFFLIFLLFGERKNLKMKGVLKIASLFMIGLVVLGMIISVSFLPVYRNLSFGARGQTKGYEYTTSWSMPTAELIDLFVPEFSGIKGHYWGGNYFKLHSEYFGIFPLILLVIGLFFCFKDRNVKFFFFIGIAALLLALGKNTPVFKIAYYILPGIKKFRAPSLIFYILTFSTVVVSAFGLKRILKKEDNKRIIIALLCFIGCYLIFALIAVIGKDGFISFIKSHFSYLMLPQSSNKLKAFTENYPLFIKGLGKSIIISIVCFVLILLFQKERLKTIYLILGLLIVMLFDQWFIEKRFLADVQHPSEYYKKDEVIKYLENEENDKNLFRIFPLHYRRSNDGILILNGIQSLGGYHPNPIRRYQELIGAGESVMFSPMNLIEYPKMINVLNGKYIIGVPLPPESLDFKFDERTREAIGKWRDYFSGYTPVHQVYRNDTLEYVIYKNEECSPRVFFVEDFKKFNDKESLLRFMKSEEFDPLNTVLLEEDPGISHPDSIHGGSTVFIKDYSANEIKIDAQIKNKGFLVLSENFYPRWHAYVDGKKTKVFLANYTLRSILLEPGVHSVVFIYEDGSYSVGKILSIIGLIILLFSFIFQFFKRKRFPKEVKNL